MTTTNVLVLYATSYGNTKKLAEAVAKGAESVEGSRVVLKDAPDVTKEDFLEADAIIMGSPVHMGSPDWRIKKVIDEICSRLWMKDLLNGKVGGVFVTGSGFGSAGGGCELTMLAMLNNMAELGLLMVPLPKNTPGYNVAGHQWGPYARSAGLNMQQTGITEEMQLAAWHHGSNITRVAAAVKGKTLYSN